MAHLRQRKGWGEKGKRERERFSKMLPLMLLSPETQVENKDL
jgi:hypothetical protein